MARFQHSGLKLLAAISPRRTGPAVCVLLIAAGIGLALFVHRGTERWSSYFETVYCSRVVIRPSIARERFDIYFIDNHLHYIKEGCAEQDIAEAFFFHIYPERAAALPSYRQSYGFVNADFDFRGKGAMVGGKCAVIIELLIDPIAQIHTGQYTPDGSRLWEMVIEPPPAP